MFKEMEPRRMFGVWEEERDIRLDKIIF